MKRLRITKWTLNTKDTVFASISVVLLHLADALHSQQCVLERCCNFLRLTCDSFAIRSSRGASMVLALRNERPSRGWTRGTRSSKSFSDKQLGRISLAKHRGYLHRTSHTFSTSGLPRSCFEADFVKTNAQIFVSTAGIFALERSLWAAATAVGVRVPTAPAGMLLVFAALLATDAINPTTARRISEWFNGARAFYSWGVALFFMPPLVQLPLSLGMLPLFSIVKYLTLIATGTIVSIIATGLAISTFAACPPEQPSSELSATHILPQHRPKINSFKPHLLQPHLRSKRRCLFRHPSPSTSRTHSSATVSPVLMAAVAGMFVSALLGRDSALIACSSVAALQFGKTLPVKVQFVCPAVITCAALTALVVSAVGLLRGVKVSEALVDYKNAGGGVFGGSGVGDLFFLGAAPAIVALGFSLYEQRHLLRSNLVPILGGSSLTAAHSVAFTAIASKLLGLEADVGLSLVTRFVTLPMAVPVIEELGACLGLAAAAVVIQGILGASIGQRLLDVAGVTNAVARGVAIGGTAHALGTASVVDSEPKTAPPAAVTFLVTGQNSRKLHLTSSDIQYLEPENTNELPFPNFCRHTFVCNCPGACFHQAHYLRFLRNACSSNCSEAVSHCPEFRNLATLVSCLGRESKEQFPAIPEQSPSNPRVPNGLLTTSITEYVTAVLLNTHYTCNHFCSAVFL